MNKVFIWKSYGDIRVYEITEALFTEVKSCLVREGFDMDLNNYKMSDLDKLITRALMFLDSEMFEYGTGTYSVCPSCE